MNARNVSANSQFHSVKFHLLLGNHEIALLFIATSFNYQMVGKREARRACKVGCQ